MISGVATVPSKYQLKYPFLHMCDEYVAKNRSKCCQIAKIFVAINLCQSIIMALEKPEKLRKFYLQITPCLPFVSQAFTRWRHP